jgi:phosphotriesterase-related protein
VSEITTVQGPVAADQIGPVMAHEHVFMSASRFFDPSGLDDPSLGEQPFTAEVAGLARWDGHAFRDNMALSAEQDYELQKAELAAYATAGGAGACLVDMTNVGIEPDHAALARISEDTGVHVVSGCAFYVHATHPEWVEDASVEEIAAAISKDVTEGFGDTGIRPGIIGEVGTSETLQACEERILRASAQVAIESGLAINVHCEPPEVEVVHQILDVLESEGHDLTRTYLSHLDEKGDLAYHLSVLDRGVVVGFDSFGQEGWFSPTWRARTDLEKAQTTVELIERGHLEQLVLAQDVCKKQHLRRFGGMGYDHVLTRVLPRMQETQGITDEQVGSMLHTTPLRLLTPAG